MKLIKKKLTGLEAKKEEERTKEERQKYSALRKKEQGNTELLHKQEREREGKEEECKNEIKLEKG